MFKTPLFCLTNDLYDDFKTLRNTKVLEHKDVRKPALDLGENVVVVNEFDYLIESVREVVSNPFTLQPEFVIRKFVSNGSMTGMYIPSTMTKLHDTYDEGDEGVWRYTYAKIYNDALYVSSTKYSAAFKNGSYLHPHGHPISCTDKWYTVQQIADSSSKELIDLMIPPDPDMFSAAHVRFIIPANLLKN